ncbi:hypothetical protein ACHAWF_010253 [Thalassiosira exigua]
MRMSVALLLSSAAVGSAAAEAEATSPPLAAFCGDCRWTAMRFDCATRVDYLVEHYGVTEEGARPRSGARAVLLDLFRRFLHSHSPRFSFFRRTSHSRSRRFPSREARHAVEGRVRGSQLRRGAVVVDGSRGGGGGRGRAAAGRARMGGRRLRRIVLERTGGADAGRSDDFGGRRSATAGRRARQSRRRAGGGGRHAVVDRSRRSSEAKSRARRRRRRRNEDGVPRRVLRRMPLAGHAVRLRCPGEVFGRELRSFRGGCDGGDVAKGRVRGSGLCH